jgi:hypothetical protein
MSWGAKPRFSASWGLGSMPKKSWFCRYEFMVLPGRKTKKDLKRENRLNIRVFVFAVCLTVTQFLDSLIYTPLVIYTHLEFLVM